MSRMLNCSNAKSIPIQSTAPKSKTPHGNLWKLSLLLESICNKSSEVIIREVVNICTVLKIATDLLPSDKKWAEKLRSGSSLVASICTVFLLLVEGIQAWISAKKGSENLQYGSSKLPVFCAFLKASAIALPCLPNK